MCEHNHCTTDAQISPTCKCFIFYNVRFWHSSAAYAIASDVGCGDSTSLPPENHSIYKWPQDLLKPEVSHRMSNSVCIACKLEHLHMACSSNGETFRCSSNRSEWTLSMILSNKLAISVNSYNVNLVSHHAYTVNGWA